METNSLKDGNDKIISITDDNINPHDNKSSELMLSEDGLGGESTPGVTGCLRRWFGPIGGGSLRGSTIAMASITFGGGCLAFPNAVAQTGPIVAAIVFIIVAIFSYYTLYILLDSGLKAQVMDYNNLIEKTMGKKMVFFSDINNLILCIGVIMSYQLTVYNFALELGYIYFGVEKTSINKLIVISFCFVLIQMPLSLLKNISSLQYASMVGTVALIYSIFIIVIESFWYFPLYHDKQGIDLPPNSDLFRAPHLGYFDTFSTFLFGFASHNGIFQVFDELKRPSSQRYKKVLARSFYIELVLYISIAFGGFYSTFYQTPDVFLKRQDVLFDGKDYLIHIAKVTLFICLHCVMAINYNIMRMSFKSMFFNNQTIPFVKDFFITLVTYIISNVAVFFIEDVTQILGVIGGFCTVVICFINPIMIHIKLSGKPHTALSNVIAWSILIFVTVFGTAATIKSLVFNFLPKTE